MLRTNVVVAEAASLIHGQFDDFLGARGKTDLTHHRAVAAADDELDGGADLVQLDAEVRKDLGSDAFSFTNQSEKEVLRADVVVVEAEGLFLGKSKDAPRSLGELVEPIGHPCLLPST